MSLRTVPMGSGKGPNQRVYHGQNDAVHGGGGGAGGAAPKAKTAKELKMEKLKQSLHGENAHVPDCLVWNAKDQTETTTKQKNGRRTKGQQGKDYAATTTEDGGREFTITGYKALPRNPELGRPKNHLYGDEGPPDAHWKQRPNDGGVAEAMVGWPKARQEEMEEGERRRRGRDGMAWDVDHRGNDDGAKEEEAKKKPPPPQRKQRLADGDSDVVMDELISHRFLRESADRLRQRREQQATDQATAHRNRHNFRQNKTSVLRAEAIGDSAGAWRQTNDPKELWKMSRFANARSRLNDCTQCRRHDCYREDGRGFPMESCRKDCKRRCDEKNQSGDNDRQMERHNGADDDDDDTDSGRGRCDHRACGCVPEHQSNQVTHEDRSHQNHLNQYSDDEEKTKHGFYVI